MGSEMCIRDRFKDVIDALNNSLQNIHFPSDPTDLIRVKADFMKVADFPNVVGAIDGTLDSNPWNVKRR